MYNMPRKRDRDKKEEITEKKKRKGKMMTEGHRID